MDLDEIWYVVNIECENQLRLVWCRLVKVYTTLNIGRNYEIFPVFVLAMKKDF